MPKELYTLEVNCQQCKEKIFSHSQLSGEKIISKCNDLNTAVGLLKLICPHNSRHYGATYKILDSNNNIRPLSYVISEVNNNNEDTITT